MLKKNVFWSCLIILQIIFYCRVNGQQSVVYELRSSSCLYGNTINSPSLCKTAARIISSSDDSVTINTNIDLGSDSSFPIKCWVEDGGALKYNQIISSNNAQCNNQWQCLCRVTCLPGKYQNQIEQTSCKNCPTGHFQSSSGSGGCSSCSSGRYQNQNGQASCKLCSAGTFQSVAGESSCIMCPSGKFYGGTGASTAYACATCADGTTSIR